MSNERPNPSRDVKFAARLDTAMEEYPKAQAKRPPNLGTNNRSGIGQHSIKSSRTRDIAVYCAAATAAFEFRPHLPPLTPSAANDNKLIATSFVPIGGV